MSTEVRDELLELSAHAWRRIRTPLEGMADACRALDFPIISGNVSLYNESKATGGGSAILPTPAIGGVGLLDDWLSWLMSIAIIGVAIAGKLGGSMIAARWTGMTWQDSFSIGALMNTRGLVELIVLNLGYDLGILPPKIFGMMVLMALTTTFMAGPLLSLAEFWSTSYETESWRNQFAVGNR